MQPIPSPRQPMVGPGGPGDASGMAGAGSEMMAGPGGNQMAMQQQQQQQQQPQQPGPDQGQMTPQDQLSKFVETL